ncbi:hypothetical protein [uncultured Acinetobacter sp.]|uniref:hypothetical protein n=1 Tax=uncultured Acinetobacter sp. TaxID=165433 RepID=UPI0026098AEE|nr:hypothetical protein [uncultured Acinetobacter sp.]
MRLNVSQDFKQRWLATPTAVRQVYLDDLARICDLLQPEVDSHTWLKQEQHHVAQSKQRIKQAYLDYQAELIAAKRLKQRLVLEQQLAEKRALQAKQAAELEQQQHIAQQKQLQVLQVIRQQQTQAVDTYVARYQKNPEHSYSAFNKAVHLPDTSMLSELESVRLRLELEAEAVIEAKVNELRRLLKSAAKEEINLVLQNSAFSSEISHQELP